MKSNVPIASSIICLEGPAATADELADELITETSMIS